MTDSLISKVSCVEDEICNYCIEVLKVMSENLGITYGQLNVYLFMVYIPLTMLAFMVLSVVNYKWTSDLSIWLTKFLILLNVFLLVFFVVNMPLI